MTNKGLPHARGGVSEDGDGGWRRLSSSPRTWGCFFERFVRALLHHVFPTHVGVFPPAGLMPLLFASLPHARGGVSATAAIQRLDCSSSPRTWGCSRQKRFIQAELFVFPTHVGVFLLQRRSKDWTVRLPHARGGVSMPGTVTRLRPVSSPRTWGCFSNGGYGRLSASVFPTHVGYFKKNY